MFLFKQMQASGSILSKQLRSCCSRVATTSNWAQYLHFTGRNSPGWHPTRRWDALGTWDAGNAFSTITAIRGNRTLEESKLLFLRLVHRRACSVSWTVRPHQLHSVSTAPGQVLARRVHICCSWLTRVDKKCFLSQLLSARSGLRSMPQDYRLECFKLNGQMYHLHPNIKCLYLVFVGVWVVTTTWQAPSASISSWTFWPRIGLQHHTGRAAPDMLFHIFSPLFCLKLISCVSLLGVGHFGMSEPWALLHSARWLWTLFGFTLTEFVL